MANEICYMEIVTQNQGKSRVFYGDVFGWEIKPAGDNYSMFKAGESLDGGLTPPMQGLKTGTVVYIQVDDIDAKLLQIEASGGSTVTGRTKVSDEHGFYALFKDPAGSVIGLWSKS